MLQIFQAAALTATMIGVIIGVTQLWLSRLQAVTTFEDQLASEYRHLISDIPIDALLGEDISEDVYRKVRELIYNYIDLTNEQIFLRQIGRVRKDTWVYWRDGIAFNLSRPVFSKVWSEIKSTDIAVFKELQRLEDEKFSFDPKKWD